ncbi:hypothetical protein [Dyella sp.]|uniref:hypothetical protein n=1 Tax=Dyella sp. TaxID=1869338 RepID=UPI002D7922F1|nr:hypothetical protein [Dyella sp.]HET7330001.1 hypothetical protein [Dyella sp.]
MKLLRDFFRIRTAGRFPLAGRRQAVRPTFTVTVPQPLEKPTETGHARPHTPRPEHVASDAPRTSRHLHLVSSH